MRQDPDIIMVGEIRDLETAEMAVQAALTGHLVLSTLHTNDAPSAVTRLLELGVTPYLLNATLNGVMAQRLVRTSARTASRRSSCNRAEDQARLGRAGRAVEVEPPGAGLQAGRLPRVPHDRLHGPRRHLRDAAVLARRSRRSIGAGADLAKIREQAFKEGMKPLRISGAMKVAAGFTTIEEVLKVAPPAWRRRASGGLVERCVEALLLVAGGLVLLGVWASARRRDRRATQALRAARSAFAT